MLIELTSWHHGQTKFTTFGACDLTQIQCFCCTYPNLASKFRIFLSQKLTFPLEFFGFCHQCCFFRFIFRASHASGLCCLLNAIFNGYDSAKIFIALIRSKSNEIFVTKKQKFLSIFPLTFQF